MSRDVPEWVGKDDNAKPPPHVRARIFDAHNGICYLAKRKINAGEPWDLDHVIALINGGENRESNMAPALRDKHREKTKADVALKSKNYQVRAKHLGLAPSKQKIASRGFAKRPAQRTASRPIERRTYLNRP